jgi:hypothetical protein
MDAPGDEPEIIRLIASLSTDYETALPRLLAIGEPALNRLLRAMDNSAPVAMGDYPQDAIQNRTSALATLGRSHVEALVAAVRSGTVRTTLDIIQGIGGVGDERLTAFAKQALKDGDF